MKKEPELLFVELREPASIRRDVLMATKDVLDSLKRYEEYKATKAEKMKALAELKHVVDDLLSLNRRLRSKMPKAPIKVSELTREKEEMVERDFTGPSPSVARPKSKLDVLQEELEKIESRLSALD